VSLEMRIREAFAKRVNDLADLTALYASQDYTPIASGTLREAIQVEKRAEPFDLTAVVSVSGVEYAKRIRDEVLPHAANPPNRAFQDFDPSPGKPSKLPPRQAAYWRGFRAIRDRAPRYAADFFNKGFQKAKQVLGYE
jgi:hypothetical protein